MSVCATYIYGHMSLSLRPPAAARVPLAAPGGEYIYTYITYLDIDIDT